MDERSGLKLVGCDAERMFMPEPPAPLNFRERAAMFPRHAMRPRPHVELGGHPVTGGLASNEDVDTLFDWLGGRMDEVARELGLLSEENDTDRPRAA